MGFIKPFIIISLLIGMLSSCSTDVDIYADYKDITIVYGLLDQTDDTSWIKVTKAFSGPGNALLYAQNPDSNNYSYKLDVKLTGIQNGVEKQVITFDTLTIKNKKPGDSIFYYPNQLMYYTAEDLNEDYTYHLSVNKKSETLTSSTEIVHDFSISSPNRYINFTTDKEIEWNSTAGGKRYEVSLVFHYKELLPNSTDTTYEQVYWYLGQRKSADVQGGDEMFIGYSGNLFYTTLENQLEEVLNVKRWAGNVDVIIASGTQELDTYLEVNDGSGNLLSEVPVYTNIEGGFGIFGSRITVVKSVQLSVNSGLKLVTDYPELGFISTK